MKILSHLRPLALFALVALGHPLLAQRTVTYAVAGNQLSGAGTAAVVLAAQGNENALGFTVTFNPAVLSYAGYVNGADVTGATVNPNVGQVSSGRVGFAIALPTGTKFAAGSRQLVVLNFSVVAPATTTSLAFGDSPIGREVSDDLAEALATTFTALSITANLPPAAPAITAQPAAATVTAGQNASFTVAASGNPAPTFKWQRSPDGTTGFVDVANGARVSGATTATLTFTGALVADAGFYRAVATNSVSPDANSNAAQLTVNKAAQTITFGAIAGKTFGDAPFALGATASSGLAVTYVSTNTAVATVSGNQVTIVGAGSTTITASQAGNADFNAAANVNQSLTVAKAAATVTLSGLSAAFDGAPKAVGVSTSPTGLPVTVTYEGSATVPSAAGSYAVVATVNAPNHQGSANGTLVIGKASQTITFAALAQRVFAAGDSFVLAATASSGLGVTYTSSDPTVASISGNTVSVLKVGTTTITASQVGNANFNPAADVARALDIVPAIQTITFAGTELAGKKFTDANFNLTASSTSGLTVAFASSDPTVASISGNTVTILKAGTTDITATQAGNANFGPAVPVTRQLVVAKATAGVTLGGLAATFNNTPKSASATTNPTGLTVVITYTGTASASTPPTNAGSYGVTATVNDTNYQGSATGQLVIAKAAQTITFAAIPAKTFGDAAFSLTATSDSGLPVTLASGTPAVATVAGNTVTILAGGTTTVTATQAGNENYLAAAPVARDLVVAKAAATVTLDAVSLAQTYTGTPRLATATTAPVAALPLVFVYTQGTNTIASPVDAGSYGVTATINDPRYQGSATGTLVVAKAAQTIAFGALDSKPFNDPNFPLTATATSGLAITYVSSDPTVADIVSGNQVVLKKAGFTDITASQVGNENYNPAAAVTRRLTVLNAGQTITFAGTELAGRTFGNAPVNLVATASSALTVTFASNNPAVATISGNVLTIVGAGSANITASQAGDSNFAAAASVTRTLTVAKAAATVTFTTVNGIYNATPRPAIASVVPAGLNLVYTFTGTDSASTPPTNAGSYTVTATVDDPNYAGSATSPHVISKSAQFITFNQASLGSPRLLDSAPFSLTATTPFGLPVSFASSNPAVAAVSGNPTSGFVLTVVGLGTVDIVASQAGDSNISPAANVTRTLTVNPVAPAFVSTPALNQTAVRGSAYLFGPVTLNALSAPVTFSATGLPAGLSVSPTSGNIAGTPTVDGTFNVVLTATNATGSATRAITLLVQPPAPIITSPASISVLAGAAINYQMVTSPAIGSSGLTVSESGAGPSGLTFVPATGILSGTAPGAPTTLTVTLNATNATGSATLPLVIVVAPNPNSPVYGGPASVSGTAGVPFSFTPAFSASTATPATPTTFALTEDSSSLPTGFNPLNTTTGAITGTTTQTGTFSIRIRATRGTLTGIASIRLTINPAATAPTVTIAGGNVRSTTAGAAFSSGNITATPSAGATISVGPLPAGLTFNSSATPPTITGNATALGTHLISISASNSAGTGPAAILSLTVAPNPLAPVITSSSAAPGRVGQTFTYNLAANPAATSFAAGTTLPAGLTLDSGTGAITGTPTAAGRTTVQFTGTNASGTGLGLAVSFNIEPPLTVPVITSNPSARAQVGQAFSYSIIASNAPTSYGAQNLPGGLSVDTVTGLISGIPTTATGATPAQVSLTAANGDGPAAPRTLALTIDPAPATPVITSAATATGRVGVALSYNITATETPTSFVASGLPAGLLLNPTTGAITGSPTLSGPVTARLAASNAAGLGAASDVVFTIAPALTAPAITSAAAVVGRAGVAFSYQTLASPGTITGFGLSEDRKESLPTGLNFNSATGVISGIPTEPGVRTVTLTATSDGGTSLPQPVTITIQPAANVPSITSAGSATGTVGAAFTYNITASENPTSRDALGLPDGLAVNQNTGVISGVPTAVGRTVATLVATNANGNGPASNLAIDILASPTAPVVSGGGTVNARAGTAFAYQITVLSGAPTSYEVIGAPRWMSVNNTTGAVSGTPDAPGTFNLFLVARNSAGASAPRALTLVVAAAPGTPVISSTRTAKGTAGTALVPYVITADPAATTFVATGLPPGLTLTGATISGTPTASGTYSVAIYGVNAVNVSAGTGGVGATVLVEFDIARSITFGN